MKHGKKLKKLNRNPAHRKSLLMNLAISLFKHERIQTTLAKAKALRPFAERLITKSRTNNLHTFRQLSSVISDKSVVRKLVGELGERFKTRPGGYTRIYKCGFRTNDAAPLALIELVDYSIKSNEGKKNKTVSYGKISQSLTKNIKDTPRLSKRLDTSQQNENKIKDVSPVKPTPKAKETKSKKDTSKHK